MARRKAGACSGREECSSHPGLPDQAAGCCSFKSSTLCRHQAAPPLQGHAPPAPLPGEQNDSCSSQRFMSTVLLNIYTNPETWVLLSMFIPGTRTQRGAVTQPRDSQDQDPQSCSKPLPFRGQQGCSHDPPGFLIISHLYLGEPRSGLTILQHTLPAFHPRPELAGRTAAPANVSLRLIYLTHRVEVVTGGEQGQKMLCKNTGRRLQH